MQEHLFIRFSQPENKQLWFLISFQDEELGFERAYIFACRLWNQSTFPSLSVLPSGHSLLSERRHPMMLVLGRVLRHCKVYCRAVYSFSLLFRIFTNIRGDPIFV